MNSAQPMPRSLPRCCASARRAAKPRQSDFLLGAVDQAGEIAAVEHRAGRGLVGNLRPCAMTLRRRSSQRIDAERRRRLVDQPLDDERGLRPAGAAIGVGRRGVGHHLEMAAIERLDLDRRRRPW